MAVVFAVAFGGAVGSLLRYGISSWVTHGTRLGGSGTFVVNILGAFALGLLIGLIESRWQGIPRLLATGLGVGVIGGFTTFSAYMWDAVQHVEDGRWPVAVLLLGGTLFCGLIAMVAGLVVGRAA